MVCIRFFLFCFYLLDYCFIVVLTTEIRYHWATWKAPLVYYKRMKPRNSPTEETHREVMGERHGASVPSCSIILPGGAVFCLCLLETLCVLSWQLLEIRGSEASRSIKSLLVRLVAVLTSPRKLGLQRISFEDDARDPANAANLEAFWKLFPSRKLVVKHLPLPPVGPPTHFNTWDGGAEMNRGLFKVLQPITSRVKTWLGLLLPAKVLFLLYRYVIGEGHRVSSQVQLWAFISKVPVTQGTAL